MEAKEEEKALLLKASAEGDVATVRALLERGGLDVNGRDTARRTPLQMAASNGHVAVVEVLLTAGADPNARDAKDRQTALHMAASNGHSAVVEMLLKAGADPNARDYYKDYQTPLHMAASNGHLAVVEMLLKAGADSSKCDKNGQTPLLAACAHHRGKIVRALLASGADVGSTDEGRHMPFHVLIEDCAGVDVTNETLSSLQQLVAFGATWDDSCDDIITKGRARPEAPALRICTLLWTQERADGRPMTYVLIEVVKRGAPNTQAYIAEIQRSREIVLRRKVCVVGAGRSGKTSFVKSITTQTTQLEEAKTRNIEYSTSGRPRLEEVEDRKIGIDLFPLKFEQSVSNRNVTNVHEVTFWDFTGHDAYQVADSLFFSPRTLILVFVDLNAFAIAYMQAAIFADEDFQEPKLLREYVEHTIMRWVRMILRHQPATEFAFIATKDDAVNGNPVTETLLKDELQSQLKTVGAVVQEMTAGKKSTFAIPEMQDGVIFVSCTSLESVLMARAKVEALICNSDRSAPMPDTYTQALQTIVATRDAAKSNVLVTRIERVFALVETLPEKLGVEAGLCCMILQTLHDLGDVLWYEDLDVGILRQTVILDPMLVIDFIRQIFSPKHTGLTVSHGDLRALPLWRSLPPRDKSLLEAMKKLLRCFKLAYSASNSRIMTWDSHLIVPALWQTKISASWLFLGDFLRVKNVPARDGTGESARVRWECLFEHRLPSSLCDDLIVASVTRYIQFKAGPDWILFAGEEGNTACRIMVDRDRRSLDQSIRIEAVLAKEANTAQIKELWGVFNHLVSAFVRALSEHEGVKASWIAWDDRVPQRPQENNLRDVLLDPPPPFLSIPWMPPVEMWESIKLPDA